MILDPLGLPTGCESLNTVLGDFIAREARTPKRAGSTDKGIFMSLIDENIQ